MISVRCLGLLWLLTVLSATAWAEVDVRTNRTEISVDESFTVIFETDSSRAAEPDFSVLETSFEILSSRRRSNYSLVNGRMTGSTAWELELIARETGVIELPPVRFGNESSQPLMITVNEKKEAVDGDGPLLLELEISDSSPYVQGEVICTLRMYFDIASSERRLSEPSMQGIDAVIKRLGDDRSYFATRAQRRYEVIERRYGIYPQASGTLKLESFSLQARILDSQRSFLARTGRMHRVQSEPVTIDVQPIPAEFPGSTWLPARGLAIDQRLDVPTPLHAGEPISLTLEIRADGLNASQLPDLEIAWPDGLRVYPETPVSEEESDARGTRALRRLSMALIAAEAGDFTLPAFRIPWWNTETDQPEFAELPERTITVLPRAGS
ncbi:MAG: BatD family protein, partial [Gammaproteobacteria bacterium]